MLTFTSLGFYYTIGFQYATAVIFNKPF